jgi:glucose-induced degradation protein 4
MPYFPVLVQYPQQDPLQGQAKACSSCHIILDSAASLFIHEADASIVCGGCRERLLTARSGLFLPESRNLWSDPESGSPPAQDIEPVSAQPTRRPGPGDDRQDAEIGPPRLPPAPFSFSSSYGRPHNPSGEIHDSANQPFHFDADTPSTSRFENPNKAASAIYTTYHSSLSPDPLIDITRLRVRSQGQYCLYPGASFQGTQKSDKNSYDVTVTIVVSRRLSVRFVVLIMSFPKDVDFSSSFLCGYLRIRGLTDDWPELTTYFDAEIIGSRYGFLTQNWGATEQEDMIHWSRFPAFRHVKNELKKPHWTMNDRDRGAVFMRWKEKFLVPDHRVQDISGASFAGLSVIHFNPCPSLKSCTVL